MNLFNRLLAIGLLSLLLSGTTYAGNLPKLIDLGADKCVPCKMMAPLLEELKQEQAGKFDVEFIDVWKHRDMASKYRVQMIPTQIFFAPDGTELYRHQGYIPKEDILKQWQTLGFDFSGN